MLCLTDLLLLILQWKPCQFLFIILSNFFKLGNVTCLEEKNIMFGGFKRKPNLDMWYLIKINGY